MSLDLLSDPWIPVVRGGSLAIIRPDQIAEPGITGLAWQRPDFNIACLELLIGLVSMAAPPKDEADWLSRFDKPDADKLREALAPFTPHFALAGNGPRFLQDMEPFEQTATPSNIKPVDMLYIDSAGEETQSKNADLVVKRNRFASLPLAEAAMALYTLQAFAPAGGPGNRTSMRGGGPMTVLVQPCADPETRFPLWQLVFANTLFGLPLAVENAKEALPWLRQTRTSQNGEITTPDDVHPLEAFFGMPRRLRLIFKNSLVVGVVQRPHGTNYVTWEHPLTPYYRKKENAAEWLPVHPKPGRISYRNWMGITMKPTEEGNGTRRTARTVYEYSNRLRAPYFELMVGGWTMDKMKPCDFSLDKYPGFRGMDEDKTERVHRLVEASNIVSAALRDALKDAFLRRRSSDNRSANKFVDTAVETFFAETEVIFEKSIRHIIDGTGGDVEETWYQTLRAQVMRMFDERVLDGLIDHDIAIIERRVTARLKLFSKLKEQVRRKMDLPMSDR